MTSVHVGMIEMTWSDDLLAFGESSGTERKNGEGFRSVSAHVRVGEGFGFGCAHGHVYEGSGFGRAHAGGWKMVLSSGQALVGEVGGLGTRIQSADGLRSGFADGESAVILRCYPCRIPLDLLQQRLLHPIPSMTLP